MKPEYRVVCPDGICRVGSACRPSTDLKHTTEWTLRLANSTRGGVSAHGTRCPGEHIIQRRDVGDWETA